MSKYYIAYGGNISGEQMKSICPEAVSVGQGLLKGWKLKFKPYATIEPEDDGQVPFIVWEISEADEKKLDAYYPDYFTKKVLDVTVSPFNRSGLLFIKAMTYTMPEEGKLQKPSPEYYQTMLCGYCNFGLDGYRLRMALREAVEAEE